MTRFTSLLTVAVLGCGSSNGNTGGDDTTNPDGNPNHPTDGSVTTSPDAPPDAPVQPGGWPSPYAAIPLTSPDGTFWGPMVTISGTKFMMDLDTGSTTIGVAGASCSTCTGITPKYAPGAGAVDEHQTASTQYADGSGWGGEIYNDAVGLGGGTPAVSLNLAAMTMQDQFFFDNSYQGILGMGAKQNAEPNTDSYFDLAKTQGLTPIMGFEICDAGTGTMWLGGYDATKASAAMAYTPLIAITDNQPFYAIDITSMSIGATVVGSGANTFEQPVVDTGTTFFYVPTSVNTKVLAAINGNASFKALFGANARLKENGCVKGANGATITVDQIDTMLPAYSMTMPGVGGGADVTFTVKPSLSYLYDGGADGWCYAMGDGGTQDATTMGDTIMRAFVTVIDEQNQRVGWAPDAGCATSPHRPIDRAAFHPHLPKPRNRVH